MALWLALALAVSMLPAGFAAGEGSSSSDVGSAQSAEKADDTNLPYEYELDEDGNATLTNGYTYVAAPTLASISPSSGILIGGQTVTLTGTNLTGATAVTIGNNVAGWPISCTISASISCRRSAASISIRLPEA